IDSATKRAIHLVQQDCRRPWSERLCQRGYRIDLKRIFFCALAQLLPRTRPHPLGFQRFQNKPHDLPAAVAMNLNPLRSLDGDDDIVGGICTESAQPELPGMRLGRQLERSVARLEK